MSEQSGGPFVGVDIGNSRVKLGLFADRGGDLLPEPLTTLELTPGSEDLDAIRIWLEPRPPAELNWYLASVNRPWNTKLVDWLHEHGARGVTLLASGDLPLRVDLERPDMVGIDRLLCAVATNRFRQPDRPAVIVDLGTAITVDLVSADGAFQGGAILPGIGMSARALAEFTDLLPLVPMSRLEEPPPALGRNTVAAMESGLFWGAVGAVRELIYQLRQDLQAQPQVVLTRGANSRVAQLIAPDSVYIPQLALSGIALSVVGAGS